MLLNSLRQEYRASRMTRFAVWVTAYGAALWALARTAGGVPGLLWVIFWIAFIPTTFFHLSRLVGYFKQRLLWRLRRRLVVTYLFIAVVPICLILVLVVMGGYIINGQFASFLVASKVHNRVEALHQLDRMIARQADHLPPKSPEALLGELHDFFIADLHDSASKNPGLSMTLRLGSLARTSSLDEKFQSKPVILPAWLKDQEFAGIVADDGNLALRAVERHPTKFGELDVILSEPFSSELLDQVGEGIGPIGLLAPRKLTPEERSKLAPSSGFSFDLTKPQPRGTISVTNDQGASIEEVRIQSKSLQVPAPAYRFDYVVYNGASLDPVQWSGDEKKPDPSAGVFFVTSRFVTLDRQLLSTVGQISALYWALFAAVGIVFLIIELVAAVIGAQLTRSITKTVDKLHEGTEKVKIGDFSYRIGLPARDQLSALGEGFDSMTASVERLLVESLEKTRLEGELEIAREVQSQLFPQAAPEVTGLRLYGVCKPARVVSGDYYDFLRLSDNRVGLVVGDISGKGISAALLMASIQSALHSQFYNGQHSGVHSKGGHVSSAEVVERLNRQLYASTPVEKYATFFYAVYEGETRRLIYTNAGHPPPFFFHRGKIERLATGGTVVGMFQVAQYSQAIIQLEPGDMLLAFTDGMTEPENSYGEEFGEERLLEVAQRASHCPPEELVEEIYRAVSDWTGSPELQDDMTLVVARANA